MKRDRKTKTAQYGKGLRYRAVYVDRGGIERSKAFRTKADAQSYLDNNTAAVVLGTWVDPSKSAEKFGTVAERWMATKAGLKPKTVAGYRSLLDTLIYPHWEDVALRDIDFAGVQEWVSQLGAPGGGSRFANRGLSPSRVIQAHQVLQATLKYAVKAGLIAKNPADDVELPRKVEGEHVYLTHAELQRLAGECGGKYEALVLLLGYCGLRFGEAVALTIGDVDLDKARIRVRRSVTYVTGQGYVEGTTKNHSARTVPVPGVALEPLKVQIGKRSADALVFPPDSRTKWVTEGALRWVFDPAAKRANVSVVPHQLRHTCASLAISAGANVKVLQTLLGHKTATMTLDRYGHLMADDLDGVALALDRAAQVTADSLRTDEGTKVAAGQN